MSQGRSVCSSVLSEGGGIREGLADILFPEVG